LKLLEEAPAMPRPRKPDPGAACAAIDALLDAIADYHRISLPLRPDYDKLAAKHARAAALAEALGHPLAPLDEAGLAVWVEVATPWSHHTCWQEEAFGSPRRHERWRQKVRAVRLAVEGLTVTPAGRETPPAVAQYVTLDQMAALLQRHKDTVASWFNRDRNAPKPAVTGGGGHRHEYVWAEVRDWLAKKSGRQQLPERFPDLTPPS
jgi:hypothetical protein